MNGSKMNVKMHVSIEDHNNLNKLPSLAKRVPLEVSMQELNEFKKSKVIISCREEYLKGFGSSYLNFFESPSIEEICEYRITDLSEIERIAYIKTTVEQNKRKKNAQKNNLKEPEVWTESQQYIGKISENKGIVSLMSSPYMLKTIIDVLPNLSQAGNSSINKANIYKVFTQKHFDNQSTKIAANEMIQGGYDLKSSFYEFSKDLAFYMWKEGKTSVDRESVNYVFNEKLGLNKKIKLPMIPQDFSQMNIKPSLLAKVQKLPLLIIK